MKTLKELHNDLKEKAKAVPDNTKAAIIQLLGAKNDQAFYDLIGGRKKLTPLEKTEIAKLYGVKVEDIDWKEHEKIIA